MTKAPRPPQKPSETASKRPPRETPGRSNAGVASALVLTLGTVEKHVASIFGKLGLPACPPARLPACQTDNRRVLAVLRYLGS